MIENSQPATNSFNDKPTLEVGHDSQPQRAPFRAVIDLERVIWDNEYRDKVREMLTRARS